MTFIALGGGMRRCDFIKIIAGSAATWPGAVHAQAPERMRRVIVLLGLEEKDLEAQGRIKEFRLGMRDLGWIMVAMSKSKFDLPEAIPI
jgi:hypothetical protein